MQVRSVTAVTQYIKMLLEADDELDDLWIEGEVSNFTRASSGHCYFTLKDSDCELRCVMWRGQAARLGWRPVAGDGVLAHGYISVYERGGAYQFYVDEIRRGGVGLWWQRFEEVRRRLEAEGLFDPARKRPLPRWPRRIGVVTSPTGAALQDILNVLRARYPLVEVVLSPCMVQGVDAPPSLVRAIERLGEEPEIDVVILARGGGSMEDLWAFNDEAVARAVAACPVPVVTGVGHETDFTIVDFVSDLRTPTPSAAAAAVVPDARELRQQIDMMAQALTDIIIGHPHGDHFDFRTVCELARRRQRQLAPLRLHINAVATARAAPPPELLGRLVTVPYSPGETLTCPGLTAQALAANHNCDYGEKAAHLLFTNAAGETLFYALDGAWLPTSTWGFLRRRPEPLTAIIWDLTCGDSDDWRVCEHCNLAMVKAMTRVLRAHSKAIGPETTLFCSHLARVLCPEHAFFAPQLASQGYVLAYDGMAITVSRP